MDGLLEKLKKEFEIRNFSKETVRSYLYSVNKFLELSKQKGLNEDAVKDYVQENLKKQNPSSVSKDLFAIKFFFANVLKQKLNMPNPKKNKAIPKILTVEEIKKMIEVTKNIKHKLIIKLLYGCRLRVSEIANLKKEDFNFDEGLIHIRLAKRKKDRFVKIPDSLKYQIQNYSNILDNKIFFPSFKGGKLTTNTIREIIKNFIKKQALAKEFILISFVTPLPLTS